MGEAGRDAESKDPLKSPENDKHETLSDFGGSLDSLRSLGMTVSRVLRSG